MKYLSIIIWALIPFNLFSQSYESAHIRAVAFGTGLHADQRFSSIFTSSFFDAKILNGKINIYGKYNAQIGKRDSFSLSYEKRQTALISDDYSIAKEKLLELGLVYNFYTKFNENTNVITNIITTILFRGHKNEEKRTTLILGPGSLFNQAGVRVGLLSYRYNMNFKDHVYNIVDANNQTIGKGHYLKSYTWYNNCVVDYSYFGINFLSAKKSSDFEDRTRGGRVTNIFLDVLLPIKMRANKMYSINDEVYSVIPQTGKKSLLTPGVRFGATHKGSGIFGLWHGFEVGAVKNYSPNSNSNTFYVCYSFGLHITPLIGLISTDN